MYFGLEELWIMTWLSIPKTFVHEAVDIFESDVIEILPYMYALTDALQLAQLHQRYHH